MTKRFLTHVLLCFACSMVLFGCVRSRPPSKPAVQQAPDLRPEIRVMSGSVKELPSLREGMNVTVIPWGNPHDIERNFRTDKNLQPAPKTIEVPHPSLQSYAALDLDGHQLLIIAMKEVVGAAEDPTEHRYCSKRGDECVSVVGNYVIVTINGVEMLMPKEQFFKVVYPDGYFVLMAVMAVRDTGPQEILMFMPKE